ncbi:hypothetical protein [Tautonia plasticadhaerens]|uniref:Uncharacterized protein n=1 Tax=Tautonia plasticadhaerens TaxID=2527974 RepID=A0A518HDM1_9BACT|nr:hypothetical protein [Tautonia plasticadhaerens]QDV38955.1 hypothetical protein ElP_69150 [Tautonia plasticadhaerens]
MKIHLTSEVVGQSTLKEYDKTLGIYAAPLYIVPTYKMTVEGVGDFEVIRAGLKRAYERHPKGTRTCDVGVFGAYTITDPTWIEYTPRTGPGTVSGAVRLWKTKAFLIHEGPADRRFGMGTFGCVEVMDATAWKRFVDNVKGPTRRGQVELVIESLTKPEATLAVTDPDVKPPWSDALYHRWTNPGAHQPVELLESDVDAILAGSRPGGVPVEELRQLALIYLNYRMTDPGEQKLRTYVEHHAAGIGP